MTGGRPKGVRDIQPRKQGAVRASPDSVSYCLEDSGCEKATEFLGYQSRCLPIDWENMIGGCPFKECERKVLDDKIHAL